MYPHKVDGYLVPEFVSGVEQFLNFAFGNPTIMSDNMIRCPCARCKNLVYLTYEEVELHLYRKGFVNGIILGMPMERGKVPTICMNQLLPRASMVQSAQSTTSELVVIWY